ncbi:MAG: 2'-deoxycytidine 5'-triphosphate deaminase [Patescibacteria group bacterium]
MILSDKELKNLILSARPAVGSRGAPVAEHQIQPASLDLRLGNRAWRMSAAMVPQRGETIQNLIAKYKRYEFEIKEGSVLEPNAVYFIPLEETLNLPPDLSALFSPKSSTGRADVFVRVLSDGNPFFDAVPAGYKGDLWLEVTPLSFLVGIAPGLELVQMRIRDVTKPIAATDDELRAMHERDGLVFDKAGNKIVDVPIRNNSLYFCIDLDRDTVGFQAKDNPIKHVDLFKKQFHDVDDFWIPIPRQKNGEMVLTKGSFYLLASKERTKTPSTHAGEIVTYDVSAGEFRSHYAGFFDNGFGAERGTHVVLEVRARDVPFRVYDGQPICRMIFEQTSQVPEQLYGASRGSNYISPAPSLGKHFKPVVW